MKSVIISDDYDTTVGLRLAGITGMFVKDEKEMKRGFKAAINDDTIGIVIVTENILNTIKDDIISHKQSGRLPLVVTIPGRGGLKDKDFIMKYVKESIGVKVD